MNRIDKKFIFLVTFMFFGILLAVQFKSTLSVNSGKLSAQRRIEQYKIQLEAEKERADKLTKEIKKMEKSKENLLNEFIKNENNSFLVIQKSQLDKVKLIAGLTNVKGPGIIIKLDDAPARNLQDPEENPMDLIIHDADVLRILNELRKSGAQALSINGERVVAMSEQVCAGPNILINNKRYPVPYVIQAIGDSELLFNNISESEIVFLLRKFRIRVEITRSDEIIIPAYNN